MLLDKVSAAQRAGDIRLMPFIYAAVWNPLGAGATTPVNTLIQVDADFILIKQYITAMSAVGVPVVTPDYLYQVLDTGSGMTYMDQPIAVMNCMGLDSGHPYYLPEAQRFAGGATITSILTNNTAVAARVDIAYSGFKCYYRRGNRDSFDNSVY